MTMPAHVMKHLHQVEGGYVNHPADRGRATNYGITQATLDRHAKMLGLPRDVRDISLYQAGQIYEIGYWNASRAPEMPAAIALAHVDAAVNHGVGRAAMLLQAAFGVPKDDRMPKVTDFRLGHVLQADPGYVLERMLVTRQAFYDAIIANNPTQAVFARGWRNRLTTLRRNATPLITASVAA